MQTEELKIKIEELEKEIEELKDEKSAIDTEQTALKIFMNSGYGALSNEYFRYFDIRLASAITSMGQTSIKGVSQYVEEEIEGIENIYNDTDSVYFNCENIVSKRFGKPSNLVPTEEKLKFIQTLSEQVINKKIDDFFDLLCDNFNAVERTIFMENEIIADIGVFLGKKKYALKIIKKDKTKYIDKTELKVTGLEIVRTSTPNVVRKALKECFKLIFETLDENIIKEYIINFKEKFYKMDITEIAFPRSVNIGTYTLQSKALPIQVRAALTYNLFIEKNKNLKQYRPIYNSEKIKYIYIKMPNPLRQNVIAFPDNKCPKEILDLIEIDYDLQFEKTFMDPLHAILTNILKWDIFEENDTLDFI